jgi:ribosome-associated heat shock protein Hsp15
MYSKATLYLSDYFVSLPKLSFNFVVLAMEKLRLDKYLWAIRIFKTRTQASSAIEEGKVKWKGTNVKPSKIVAVGEQYTVKTPARRWTIEVTGLLDARKGYEEAVKYYLDITPEEDKQLDRNIASSFYTGKRLSKTGHPTKKQRRDLEDFLSAGSGTGTDDQ